MEKPQDNTSSQNESLQHSTNNTLTSESSVKLTIKEFIAVGMVILSFGISIGGSIKIISDVKDLSVKLDKISENVNEIKVQNAKLEVLVEGKAGLK